MLGAALIVFRETLEAALLVGIIAAATSALPMAKRWIGAGVAAGIAGAVLIALAMSRISGAFEGMGQEVLNASILACAVAMLGYTVEALDVPVGRVADIMLDDARWTVRAISVRTHAGVLAVPVLAVAALFAAERRMVPRLDRKRLLRFRYPRAVEARL